MEKITLNLPKRYMVRAGEPETEEVEVKVGDGATICYYSDRKPCTIIDIDDKGRWIKVQEDKAIRLDHNGMSDCQEYAYERDPNGCIEVFKRTRKDHNKYTDNGICDYPNYGSRLVFGYREKYYDYSF